MFKKIGLFVVILGVSALSVGIVFADQNKKWHKLSGKSYESYSDKNNRNDDERDREEDRFSSLQKRLDKYKVKKQADAEADEQEDIIQESETEITTDETEDQQVNISTKTEEDTKKVEYYVEPVKTEPEESGKSNSDDVVLPTYLGTAQEMETGDFNLTVDANNTLPNGTYHLKPKLYKKDGSVKKGKKKTIIVESKIKHIAPEDKKKFEKSEADTDNDNIPDKEEIRLGTNPLLADSDGDGFLDGDEIKNGFDPMKFSPGDKSDKIAYESPKPVLEEGKTVSSSIVDEKFAVNSVVLATVETPSIVKDTPNTEVKKPSSKKVARFSGKALPNIFVTLYIFSDPIVVTVKTDAAGNWSYDLDKEIPDGNHEVYVAVTDNVGKITSQSQALPFVKTADAIDIVPTVSAASSEEVQNNATPIEKSKTQFFLMMFVIITTFVGIAFVLIGRKSSFIK